MYLMLYNEHFLVTFDNIPGILYYFTTCTVEQKPWCEVHTSHSENGKRLISLQDMLSMVHAF